MLLCGGEKEEKVHTSLPVPFWAPYSAMKEDYQGIFSAVTLKNPVHSNVLLHSHNYVVFLNFKCQKQDIVFLKNVGPIAFFFLLNKVFFFFYSINRCCSSTYHGGCISVHMISMRPHTANTLYYRRA